MPQLEDNLENNTVVRPNGKPNSETPDRKRKIIIISLIGVAIAAVTFASYWRFYVANSKDGKSDSKTLSILPKKERDEPKKVPSPLNGEVVTEEEANRHPLAVIIENHPDARPQSGLSQASIVYEAIAEGGITRFLAIFGPHEAKEVGPVRSARTFFVDWASEYGAYLAHAGGAPDALDLIPKSNVEDLPDTKGTFERKARGNVATEHTLFSSTSALYKLASDKKYPATTSVESLEFKDDAKAEERGTIAKITIPFSTESYTVNWDFDKEKNIYLRTLAGTAHKDRINGEQLTAKNVIIQKVARQPIALPGAKPTYRFTTTGTGNALVYIDGKEIKATWKKSSQKSRTKFYDGDKEIKFNRGVIFYEIVPPDVTTSAS